MNKQTNPNFMTPGQILTASRKYVAENCGGAWPEDEWFELGNWDINLWADDQTGQAFATAYPITPRGSTQTNQGITIPTSESLLSNEDGSYSLPAQTNTLLIHAGEYNGQAVDVVIERRTDGGLQAGLSYGGDAYDRVWVGE
jgi:hypothetical protein